METEMTIEERLGQTGGTATTKEHKRQRGRSARVTFKEWDGTKANEVTRNATFHCWALRTAKMSDENPKKGNLHSETVALVEFEDGKVRMVRPEKIQFTDRMKKEETNETATAQ